MTIFEFSTRRGPAPSELATAETPLLVVPVFKDENPLDDSLLAALDDACLGGAVERAHEEGDVKGKEESILLYGESGGPTRVGLLGVGARSEFDREKARRFGGRAVRMAEGRSLTRLRIYLPASDTVADQAQAATEGAALAAFRFDEEKSPKEDDPILPVAEMELSVPEGPEGIEEAIRVGALYAEGENFARTLQNRPGNRATPTHLGEMAREWVGEAGVSVRVLGRDEIEEERMHALLAVSRGSVEEPRFIVMEHNGGAEGEAPLVLVGKGLTFDAGGISLKPPAKMGDMKFDMSGGAAVIGAMRAIGRLGVPMNVVGIVPSSENLPSGSALKPGDIIPTRAGKTVEILNTDAEGRLILCDALDFAREFEPAAIVDCATLTGSVVVGLGNHAIGMMATDDDVARELEEAGERVWERCWRLPLWQEYRKQLDSTYADLQNVGGRGGGSITAGWYLREFVGDVPWAHLDVAGTAYGDGDLPYQRKGGRGWPTRLLVEWVRSRSR